MKKINYIIPKKLYPILDDNFQFIDLRNETDFRRSHLKNFINIPSSHLLKNIDKLNVFRPVVLLCYSGHLANYYAPILLEHGFQVLVVDGGYHAIMNPINDSIY